MVATNTTLSIACVPEACVHFADPKGTMLHADQLPTHFRGGAIWDSAGQLHAVLVAMSTFLHCEGGAVRHSAPLLLSTTTVLFAQTTSVCFASAAFNRARFSAVHIAESSCVGIDGAVLQRAQLLLLPLLRFDIGGGGGFTSTCHVATNVHAPLVALAAGDGEICCRRGRQAVSRPH